MTHAMEMTTERAAGELPLPETPGQFLPVKIFELDGPNYEAGGV